MTARDQIDDAKYLLALLKDKNDRTEVRALLSGLLAIIRSIPDHLLEEYNTKLALNIPLSEELRIKTFCCKAIQLNNSKAISFINSYMKEIQILTSNPLWKIVKKKRDINIHRRDIPLKKQSHRVASIPPLKIDVSSKAIARDKEGNIRIIVLCLNLRPIELQTTSMSIIQMIRQEEGSHGFSTMSLQPTLLPNSHNY